MRRKKQSAPLSPPPRRKELSDSPIKLCNEISRISHTKMRETRENDGVMTQPGARLVLSFLAIKDGITQLDLVKATHLRAPTVSVILKKMEAEGMVKRESDPNDLRVTRVYLTEEGRKIDSQNIENIKKIDALSTSKLTSEEIGSVMSILAKIRDSLMEEPEKQ